jgi:hypothetical protein
MNACRDYTGCAEGFVVPVRESDGALLSAAFCGPALDLESDARAVFHLAGYYYATRGREILNRIELDPICPLTPRQIECLRWVHAGKTDGEIGSLLGVSGSTVHVTAHPALGGARSWGWELWLTAGLDGTL